MASHFHQTTAMSVHAGRHGTSRARDENLPCIAAGATHGDSQSGTGTGSGLARPQIPRPDAGRRTRGGLDAASAFQLRGYASGNRRRPQTSGRHSAHQRHTDHGISGPLLIAPCQQQQHEDIRLTMLSLPSDEVARRFDSCDLDIGVTFLDDRRLAGFQTLPLFFERSVLAVRDSNHPA